MSSDDQVRAFPKAEGGVFASPLAMQENANYSLDVWAPRVLGVKGGVFYVAASETVSYLL
jgi:hypothetical protein